MNDALAGMIPYDSIGLYEQPKPMFRFKMPRVVPEQKSKFESDELFRRLSRESEVRCDSVEQVIEATSANREHNSEKFNDFCLTSRRQHDRSKHSHTDRDC